ncbi:MAG: hypothetical protein RL701_3272 [Pseudomonadota bacterium]
MLDIFSAMTSAERVAQRAAYRQFLLERDGEPNIEQRTFSRRELGMERFKKPLPRLREIDRDQFFQQHALNFSAKLETLPPEAKLLLALVTINGAEGYAVDQNYELVLGRVQRGEEDDIELLLHIEESYHGRILLSSAVLYGLEVKESVPPPASFRALIIAMTRSPDLIARPLIMAGELVSLATLLNLFHAAGDILKHDAELRDAVEDRLIEVLTDEVGHITFNRMSLGATGLACVRSMLPAVAAASLRMMPSLRSTGLLPTVRQVLLATDPARLPDAVRRGAFLA